MFQSCLVSWQKGSFFFVDCNGFDSWRSSLLVSLKYPRKCENQPMMAPLLWCFNNHFLFHQCVLEVLKIMQLSMGYLQILLVLISQILQGYQTQMVKVKCVLTFHAFVPSKLSNIWQCEFLAVNILSGYLFYSVPSKTHLSRFEFHNVTQYI